jgi:hypothetical protein
VANSRYYIDIITENEENQENHQLG